MRIDAETVKRVAEAGRSIYASDIEHRLGPEDHGRLVLIEVTSRDFEITTDEQQIDAINRLRARHADPEIYTVRVGSKVVSHMGGASPDA